MYKILQTVIWVTVTGSLTYLLMMAVTPSDEKMRKVGDNIRNVRIIVIKTKSLFYLNLIKAIC